MSSNTDTASSKQLSRYHAASDQLIFAKRTFKQQYHRTSSSAVQNYISNFLPVTGTELWRAFHSRERSIVESRARSN